MLKEIVNSIVETEARAEKMGKEAYSRGREIYAEHECEADKIRRDVIAEVRATICREYSEADSEATLCASKIVAEGKAEAESLVLKVKDTYDDTVKDIVKRISKLWQ